MPADRESGGDPSPPPSPHHAGHPRDKEPPVVTHPPFLTPFTLGPGHSHPQPSPQSPQVTQRSLLSPPTLPTRFPHHVHSSTSALSDHTSTSQSNLPVQQSTEDRHERWARTLSNSGGLSWSNSGPLNRDYSVPTSLIDQ